MHIVGARQSYQRRFYAAKAHCRGDRELNAGSGRRALAIMGPSMLEREEEEKGRHSIYKECGTSADQARKTRRLRKLQCRREAGHAVNIGS